MKILLKYSAVFTLAFIITVLSVIISSGADIQSEKLYNDGKGIFLIRINSNKLNAVELLPSESNYTYTFSDKVISSYVLNNKIYILTKNNNNGANVYKAANGKISSPVVLKNVKLNNSSLISVDNSENLFIKSSTGDIKVFNKSGNSVNTFKGAFNTIFPFDGYNLAFSGKSIYKITALSKSLLANDTETSLFYKISDSFISDCNGNIYKSGNSVSKVLSSNIRGYYNAAETKNYIVVYSDNKFLVYSKSGLLLNTIPYNKSVYGVTSYGGKLAVIIKNSSGYSFELFAQSKFTEAAQTAEEKKLGINLSNFRHTKKYIYINRDTTIKEFKDKISYDNYEISFGNRKSGNIRTNMEVKFTKGASSVSYIFIVRGDVTGEGNVNSRDEAAMFKHLLNQVKLKGVYKLAGDLNSDKKLSNSDLVLISRMKKV